jgi:hypothetical protein
MLLLTLSLALFMVATPEELCGIHGIKSKKASKITAFVAARKSSPTSWNFHVPGIGNKTMPKIIAYFMSKAVATQSSATTNTTTSSSSSSRNARKVPRLPAWATLAKAAGEETRYTAAHAAAVWSTGVINGRLIVENGYFMLYMRHGVCVSLTEEIVLTAMSMRAWQRRAYFGGRCIAQHRITVCQFTVDGSTDAAAVDRAVVQVFLRDYNIPLTVDEAINKIFNVLSHDFVVAVIDHLEADCGRITSELRGGPIAPRVTVV